MRKVLDRNKTFFYLGNGPGVGLLFRGHYLLVFFFASPIMGLQRTTVKLQIVSEWKSMRLQKESFTNSLL